jgi:hypothetical protein
MPGVEPSSVIERDVAVERCDVCIVGAGIAGLNALFVASQYLSRDRWYPLPRRMVDTAQFVLTHRREREHQRRTLDTVRERFDVRCGPLIQAAR